MVVFVVCKLLWYSLIYRNTIKGTVLLMVFLMVFSVPLSDLLSIVFYLFWG